MKRITATMALHQAVAEWKKSKEHRAAVFKNVSDLDFWWARSNFITRRIKEIRGNNKPAKPSNPIETGTKGN